MMPAACVRSRARATCVRMTTVSAAGNGPCAATILSRSSPRKSSITRKGAPVSGSTPESKVSTMWSLSIFAVTRASSSKRSRIPLAASTCGSITFSARLFCVLMCSHS
jgi:hypothetical protein